jgi:predicted trehalose synthase
MNAFLQIIAQLVESVPGSVWLESRFFPFHELKNPRARLFDAVFFSQGAHGALGLAWMQFEGREDELVTLPFRLARYSEDGDLIMLTPWSLREASGDSALYEAWRYSQHTQNPMRTARDGRFSHRFTNGEPNLLALNIWSDSRNTCVRLESQEAYKIFRTFNRFQPDSMEVDVLEYLNQQDQFLNYPKLVSVYEYSSRDIVRAHVAISTRYIHNQGTLWQDLSVRVQHARFPQPMQERSSFETWASVLRTAEQLGRLMGEFHRAMSRVRDVARLAPESNTGAARDAWFAMMMERLDWRLSEVVQTSHVLFGGTFDLSKAQACRDKLLAQVKDTTHLGLLIRVHGNAHLGQILLSNEQLFLLDFEADDLDDPKYREQKQSSLEDVASMLLSLRYSWRSTERSTFSHVFSDFIDPESNFGRHVQTTKRQFVEPRSYAPTYQKLEAVFMRFYRHTVFEDSGSAELVPANETDFDNLLKLYSFMRILKETLRDYEAGNPRAKLTLRLLEEFVAQEMGTPGSKETDGSKETADLTPSEPAHGQ